jgi:hypothetical protein
MTEPEKEIEERTQRQLAMLADGTLKGRERTTLEQRVAAEPELARALARQRAALSALRGLDLPAPVSLRERIEDQKRAPSRAVRSRRLAIGGGLAGAAAAAALVVALVLPAGGGGPTVVEAASLAERPATEQSVAIDPADPKLLEASVEGVPFPNLEGEFGWRQAGERSDELDGRKTRTVFYERGGERIGYTIISGESVDPPDGASETNLNDVDLASLSEGGQEIVTWLRDGKTCVLAGEGVSTQELLTLASWKGDGAVPF